MKTRSIPLSCRQCGAAWSVTEGEPTALICQSCGSGNVVSPVHVEVTCINGHKREVAPNIFPVVAPCDICPPIVRQNITPCKISELRKQEPSGEAEKGKVEKEKKPDPPQKQKPKKEPDLEPEDDPDEDEEPTEKEISRLRKLAKKRHLGKGKKAKKSSDDGATMIS